MKHTKKLLIIMTIAWVLLLMVVFSQSWIARNWTPSITQNNITISSSSALLISLTEDGTDLSSSVSLNSILATSSFTLKQVSSADGRSFHTVDFLPTLSGLSPVFTKDTVEPSDDNPGRYINFTFYLKRQTSNNPELATDKLVYIHPESYIKSVSDDQDISNAIRVAITIDNNEPVILANCSDQYNGQRNTTAANAAAEGKDVYTNYTAEEANLQYNGEATSAQTAYGLYYWNGGRTSFDYDNDPTNDYEFTANSDRALVRMATGQICTVNLKIWLEGGDETCTEEIAGKVFDFMIKFDSLDVPIEDDTVTE